MWGSQDPSWFQESIGVQKGRVNVYLLPWCDRVCTEGKTDWPRSWALCMCACLFLNFCSSDTSAAVPYSPIYSCYGVTIPPSDSTDKRFSLCDQFWRASWLQEHEEDACNCCCLFSIRCWRSILLIKEIFFSNGLNVFSFFFASHTRCTQVSQQPPSTDDERKICFHWLILWEQNPVETL